MTPLTPPTDPAYLVARDLACHDGLSLLTVFVVPEATEQADDVAIYDEDGKLLEAV
jgi:hypothetical protein